MTNQLIIKYKDFGQRKSPLQQSMADEMDRLGEIAREPLTYFREMSGDAHVLRLSVKMPLVEVQALADRIRKLPEIEYAEPDRILTHTLTPNDTYYSLQWHYFAVGPSNYGFNAPAAWDILTGASTVVVAVIDTGITSHAEFSGRTVSGYDFISVALVANDGDARDGDPSDPGDWITADESANGFFKGCQIRNSSWHGTHTSGTIGAKSNNSTGVAGINWSSKILPVRVMGKCGGFTSDIADAIRWSAGLSVSGVPANSNPAKVINMSLGGSGACDTTSQSAITAAVNAGATVVVSAGNSNLDAKDFSPASCDGVITVAATTKSSNKASYSNYGATVEISAPGGETGSDTSVKILSTLNTGTTVPVADAYAYNVGTSMAAPHVSGVASLLYSYNPSLTPTQILNILQNSATYFPSGSTCTTSTCGTGIVNAGNALGSLQPTAVDILSFTATGESDGIHLSWQTASEINNVGFNIYRASSPSGERVRVNDGMIPHNITSNGLRGSYYEYI